MYERGAKCCLSECVSKMNNEHKALLIVTDRAPSRLSNPRQTDQLTAEATLVSLSNYSMY